MKVLIGITSKNRAAILPKAINSALEQVNIDKKVVVFDDASTDKTADLQYLYTNIQWIISKEPKGLVYARNMFLEISNAEYFCSLDDDAWFLTDDSLSKAINYMDENPGVAVVGFDMLTPDRSEITKHQIVPEKTNEYIGCGHVLRVNIVKKVGKYIPFPNFYGAEEKDLCIRLIDEGCDIIKLNGLYVWHDKTNIARDVFKQKRSGICNDLVYMYRRSPPILLIAIIFYKLLIHFIANTKEKNKYALKAYFLGVKDFIHFILSGKGDRKPVSYKGFIKFVKLSKK